tara:strand:- start:869 stop:1081 length:213 start_codon:yes stop_codon:yes gene_type:complete
MPSKNKAVLKALKDGKITKKQYAKLPDALLLGIAKKADKKGGIKQKEKKVGKEKGKVGRPKAGSMVKVVE